MPVLHYDHTKVEDSFGFKMKSLFSNFSLFEGGIGIVGQYRVYDRHKLNEDTVKRTHENAKKELMLLLSKKILWWLVKNGYLKHEAFYEIIERLPEYYEYNTIETVVEPWEELRSSKPKGEPR